MQMAGAKGGLAQSVDARTVSGCTRGFPKRTDFPKFSAWNAWHAAKSCSSSGLPPLLNRRQPDQPTLCLDHFAVRWDLCDARRTISRPK